MRATGLVRDHIEVEKRRVSFRAMRLGTPTLPLSMDLSSFAPPIRDQNGFGMCVGEAYSCASNTRLAAAGTPVDAISPFCVYKLARCVDRYGQGGLTVPLSDSGTTPGSAITALSNWGVVSEVTWGTEDATTINAEPTLTELEEASDFILNGAYFLTSDSDQRYIDIMTALCSGFPVCMSLAASGDVFNNYTGGVLGSLSGPLDHENYCVGYTLSSVGDYASIVLKCVNSWGTSWGEAGFYRANRAFVDQCADWAVLDVVSTGKER
jgi:hypothetical protein